jgi:hypothetical protein
MRIIAPASFSAFAFAGLLELWSMGVRRAFGVIRLSILDNLFNSTAPRSKDLRQPQRMDSNPYRLAIHICQPLIHKRRSEFPASWTAEETDETCCAFGVAGQFGIEFIPGETWR